MKPEVLLYLEVIFSLLCSTGYTWAIHHFCTRHFACMERHKRLFLLLPSVLPAFAAWTRLYSLLCSARSAGCCLSLEDWILLCITPSSPLYHLLPLLWQCLLVFWLLQLYEGTKPQKLSAAAILLAAASLLSHFMEALLNCLISLVLHITHTEYTLLLSHGLGYLVILTTSACSIGMITLLSKRLNGFFTDRLPRWYLMVSVPLFGIVILWDIIDLCASHGILLRGGDYLNPYYNELFSHAGICILSVLCICATFFYLFGMDRIDIEQKQKNRYRSQVLFYQMLETQYNRLERLRHDMKNHIIGLQRLIDNQEWDKLTDYIHKMADFGNIDCADDMTGRSTIDALLYYKKNNFQNCFPDKENSFAKPASQISGQPEPGSIRWECDVQIPPDCPVDDFDLCVIFGNLLDNALEACRKLPSDSERFIQVCAHMVKKCLLIEITNSMPQSGNRKDGIGLRNVRETAGKYNGTLQITEHDNIFCASVLLAPAPDKK